MRAKDNNSKGIVLIIIAMTLFAMQDSLIKFIFEKSALYEIFFGRYFVAAVLLFFYIKFKKQKVNLKNTLPCPYFCKSHFTFFSFFCFFYFLNIYAFSNS
jgi:drug/metabolite transporter (DMT)-like permease